MKRTIAITAALLLALAFSSSVVAQVTNKSLTRPDLPPAKPKPLTTVGLAKSLLTLAEKAQAQGMIKEAEAIMAIIPTILTGTPADQIKPAAALCDTDMDCQRKFGGRK